MLNVEFLMKRRFAHGFVILRERATEGRLQCDINRPDPIKDLFDS